MKVIDLPLVDLKITTMTKRNTKIRQSSKSGYGSRKPSRNSRLGLQDLPEIAYVYIIQVLDLNDIVNLVSAYPRLGPLAFRLTYSKVHVTEKQCFLPIEVQQNVAIYNVLGDYINLHTPAPNIMHPTVFLNFIRSYKRAYKPESLRVDSVQMLWRLYSHIPQTLDALHSITVDDILLQDLQTVPQYLLPAIKTGSKFAVTPARSGSIANLPRGIRRLEVDASVINIANCTPHLKTKSQSTFSLVQDGPLFIIKAQHLNHLDFVQKIHDNDEYTRTPKLPHHQRLEFPPIQFLCNLTSLRIDFPILDTTLWAMPVASIQSLVNLKSFYICAGSFLCRSCLYLRLPPKIETLEVTNNESESRTSQVDHISLELEYLTQLEHLTITDDFSVTNLLLPNSVKHLELSLINQTEDFEEWTLPYQLQNLILHLKKVRIIDLPLPSTIVNLAILTPLRKVHSLVKSLANLKSSLLAITGNETIYQLPNEFQLLSVRLKQFACINVESVQLVHEFNAHGDSFCTVSFYPVSQRRNMFPTSFTMPLFEFPLTGVDLVLPESTSTLRLTYRGSEQDELARLKLPVRLRKVHFNGYYTPLRLLPLVEHSGLTEIRMTSLPDTKIKKRLVLPLSLIHLYCKTIPQTLMLGIVTHPEFSKTFDIHKCKHLKSITILDYRVKVSLDKYPKLEHLELNVGTVDADVYQTKLTTLHSLSLPVYATTYKSISNLIPLLKGLYRLRLTITGKQKVRMMQITMPAKLKYLCYESSKHFLLDLKSCSRLTVLHFMGMEIDRQSMINTLKTIPKRNRLCFVQSSTREAEKWLDRQVKFPHVGREPTLFNFYNL